MHYRPIHRLHVTTKSSPVRFRQLFQPRALVIALPLMACLLCSGAYGAEHTYSVAHHSRGSSPTSQPATGTGTPHSSPNSSPPTQTPNSNQPTPSTAPGTSATGSGTTPSLPSNSTAWQQLTQALTQACNLTTKTLAAGTEQQALSLEDSRHNAQMALLNVTDFTNTLFAQNALAALNTELNLHTINLQKIDGSYQTSLAASHCSPN